MSAPLAAAVRTVMSGHPCFDERAHDRVGRVHLPVALRCNIHCRFCERRVCAHLTSQHPGWAQRLLSTAEAIERVRELAQRHSGEHFVVGVAGPGEPLANDATFEALGLVQGEFPNLTRCVSTNGLLLEEKLPALLDLGVSALTVTVNAADGEVGRQIYARVHYRGITYRGREGIELLIERQMMGIQAALSAGLAIKVNTVLVPGINDAHLVRLTGRLRELGVRLMNVMPLIPAGQMAHRRPPTCDELSHARASCAPLVPQFRKCEQCSADVVRFLR